MSALKQSVERRWTASLLVQPARVPDGQDCDRRQQHATYRHHRPHRQAQQHLNGRAPPLARTIICTVLDMGSSSGLPEYCKPLAISKQLRRQGFAPMALEALIPGITVGCMVVPQGIAYALMAGLPPVYGLYSATAALFVYAFLGCSPQLAIGPVAMVALLVKSTTDSELGDAATEADTINVAITLTFLVGCFQLLFGVFRLGAITNFISHDVLNGFTSGAGIIIAFSQLKYVFGITVGRHEYPWQTFYDVLSNLNHTQLPELLLSVSCLVMLVGMKMWRKSNPPKKDASLPMRAMQLLTQMSALVTILIATPVASLLRGADIEIKVVGPQPSGLPPLSTPDFDLALSSSALVTSALIIAIIAFMEAFAVAHAVAPPPSDKDGGAADLDANQELIALGAANLVGACFSHFPVAGGFGRTAVSAKAGSRSQLSGVVTGVLVLLALLFLMPLFETVPYAALAAIIEIAVLGIVEVTALRTAWRVSRPAFWVSMSTLVAVLGLGFEFGLFVGTAISIGALVVKMSHPHMAVLGRTTEDGAEPDTGNRMAAGSWRDTTRVKQAVPPANGTVLRVDGAINFASSAAILAKVTALVEEEAGAEGPQFFVLHMANVEHIDLSGLHMLHSAQSTLERQGVTLLVSQATFAVRDQLAKMADLGHAAPRLFSTIDDAVAGWGDHAAFPVLEP